MKVGDTLVVTRDDDELGLDKGMTVRVIDIRGQRLTVTCAALDADIVTTIDHPTFAPSRTRVQDIPADAVAKYQEFHRYEPKQIGAFPVSFHIPRVVYRAGKAKWVTYRSAKVDPETLRKPRTPIDYIHEHDAGVVTYMVNHKDADGEEVDVPERFQVDALVRLGICLGFCFEDLDGEKSEVQSRRPMPDLYTTPDGKCLLVVQSRQKVLAMTWGGALGVFARGIDG